MNKHFALAAISFALVSQDSFACSFALPRLRVSHNGMSMPEFSSSDLAFKGVIVGRIKTAERVGYTLRVLESWTDRVHPENTVSVYFFDYDLNKCEAVEPSATVDSNALKDGTLVRVVSSSHEMPSSSFGWEFYVY